LVSLLLASGKYPAFALFGSAKSKAVSMLDTIAGLIEVVQRAAGGVTWNCQSMSGIIKPGSLSDKRFRPQQA
jgi:hypothetical protein